jgi:hypothetical protein
MIKIHQKWSMQKVKFQVNSCVFLAWHSEFEIYKALAHETTSNTLQISFRTCVNIHFTVALPIGEGHFGDFTLNHIMLIKPIW